MSQKELAARSGVSLGSAKSLETTGEVSLTSLLSMALALNCLEAFADLFIREYTLPRPVDEALTGVKK